MRNMTASQLYTLIAARTGAAPEVVKQIFIVARNITQEAIAANRAVCAAPLVYFYPPRTKRRGRMPWAEAKVLPSPVNFKERGDKDKNV